MQANEKYNVPAFSGNEAEIKKEFDRLKEENVLLKLDNEQLKRELEREQILHKNLYNEWKELKSGKPVEKEGKIKIKRYVRKRSSFYGLITGSILLSAFIVYWAISGNSNGNAISTPIPVPADTTTIDSTSKTKIQVLSHKSAIVKPAIRSKQKKNSTYSFNTDFDFSYRNESVTKNETTGIKKIDSAFPGN